MPNELPGLTEPPLIHFTTADLGNMADGRYDLDQICDLISQIGAVVVVTKQHLMEFYPLREESREKRFALADRLPMVLVHWMPADIWVESHRQWELQQSSSAELRAWMGAGPEGEPPWLNQIRQLERRMGEAEFFARSARLVQPGDGFSKNRLKKFLRLNEKHGSNIRPSWERTERSVARLEKMAPVIKRIVPEVVRTRIADAGYRLQARLNELEPRLNAWSLGVDPQHLAFQLWWETRKKLWAKPDEVGGLAERIDLQELMLWPVCAMLTVDKRVHNAVTEALRSLQLQDEPSIVSRFVRAGSEKKVMGGLEALLERRRAVEAGK